LKTVLPVRSIHQRDLPNEKGQCPVSAISMRAGFQHLSEQRTYAGHEGNLDLSAIAVAVRRFYRAFPKSWCDHRGSARKVKSILAERGVV